MRKSIIIILSVVGMIILPVYIFKWQITQSKNGFNRQIYNINLKLSAALELPDRTFVFAGKIGESIYLNRYSDPFHLYSLKYDLKKISAFNIKYHAKFHTNSKPIFKDYLKPLIFSSNLNGEINCSENNSARYGRAENFNFDFIQALSPSSIIVRGKNSLKHQKLRILKKIELKDSVTVKSEYPLPSLSNGTFTNDGVLLADIDKGMIFYMYFYRGEILGLDTNLNFQYLVKTIDTVRFSNIKTRVYNTQGDDGRLYKKIMQRTPNKFINTHITTYGNNIFVCSRLKSDNETDIDFFENQIVDVYSISDGTYKYSFYIPKYRKKKLDQFQIYDNQLVAIYGESIVCYRFQQNRLK